MPTLLQNCYHYTAVWPPLYIYICNLSIQRNERNVKPPLKNKTNSATLKGNLTFQTKFSNRISTSSSPLPITPKNTVWNRQKESQKSAHHISIMGNFLTKPAKWSL